LEGAPSEAVLLSVILPESTSFPMIKHAALGAVLVALEALLKAQHVWLLIGATGRVARVIDRAQPGLVIDPRVSRPRRAAVRPHSILCALTPMENALDKYLHGDVSHTCRTHLEGGTGCTTRGDEALLQGVAEPQ
jgi:hypothetical protein